jgi:hypothetical protein
MRPENLTFLDKGGSSIVPITSKWWNFRGKIKSQKSIAYAKLTFS